MGGNPIQTLDLETAARLSGFAGALLAVAEQYPKSPVSASTEPMSVRHFAESLATAERGSARFQLLSDVAGTVVREGYVWTVTDERLPIAAVKAAFATLARVLSALDPDPRLLAESLADPWRIAKAVVAGARSQHPADFAEGPADRRSNGVQPLQAVTNSIVLRIVVARTLEAILAHPAAGIITGAGRSYDMRASLRIEAPRRPIQSGDGDLHGVSEDGETAEGDFVVGGIRR